MIVVTTPTGSIGSKLVKKLVDANESVRVIVRDPSKLAPELQGKVDVVQGSHGDPAVLKQASQGADVVFWIVPPPFKADSMDAAYVDFSRPAAELFQNGSVPRVVVVSALGRGTEQSKHAGLVTASLAMDGLIAATGVHLRTLIMPSFMDNLLNQAGAIKGQGMFFSPLLADRKFPTCATEDIADAAARLLRDLSWTGQQDVPVLGPADISLNEMAETLSEVLGKPVAFKQIPAEAFADRLAGLGMSPAVVQGYADMMAAKNEGLDNAEPRTAESSTPTSFRQWAETVLKPAVLA